MNVRWTLACAAALAIVAGGAIGLSGAQQQDKGSGGSGGGIRVLVFSKTVGYRHRSIPEGIEAMKRLGDQHGWQVVATEDSADFSDENLKNFDVTVWLNTTLDVLDEQQQAAFKRFIQSGKGYVGVHSAADTEYDWPWYGRLVGAYFKSHPNNPNVRQATFVVEDQDHPATKMLPENWVRSDEHYNYRANPRPNVNVLIRLDETSYDPGPDAMGDHPIAWYHFHDGGRSFYTGLGHTNESFRESLFLQHLTGAVRWAAGLEGPHPEASE